MSEVARPVPAVGVDEFSDEVWAGVASSYIRSAYRKSDDEVINPDYWYYISADDVLTGRGEYRLGSIITIHSKLLVCQCTPDLLHFSFFDNADQRERAYVESRLGITEQSIQNDHQQRITTFLSGLGIARQITDCIY